MVTSIVALGVLGVGSLATSAVLIYKETKHKYEVPIVPTLEPTDNPTNVPTEQQSIIPTEQQTEHGIIPPINPTEQTVIIEQTTIECTPTLQPTEQLTIQPTTMISELPTYQPSITPTLEPKPINSYDTIIQIGLAVVIIGLIYEYGK